MMNIPRDRVFRCINGERAYQDDKWPNSMGKSVDEFALYIQGYANELTSVASHTDDQAAKLAVVRKIGALAVACMEANGTVARED